MSAPVPIYIAASVDGAERPALIAAAEQLNESLRTATEQPWSTRLGFHRPGAAMPASAGATVVVASLLPEVDRVGETLAETEARWRTYVAELQATGAPVFVCTVFRHLADRAKDGAHSPRLERIRRLNRMAAELSHDLDVAVVDIDRAFAHVGGRVLQTDYRLSGVLAAELAGHTVAWSLLSFGLYDVVPDALLEQVKTILGDLQQVDVLIERRLAKRVAALASNG